MANVKFSRREFEKHIKINQAIEERIRLFGTPLESVTDNEIEIEIFPNRPDLLSLQGYLRSFKAFLGKETGLKKYKINKPEKNYKVKINSSVKNIRPFTACAIVKDLNFDDEKIKEIIDIQEKLHATVGRNRKRIAIGIYPLEKIKLPITYEAKNAKEIKFVPLESDREMTGSEILQRHPTGREYAKLLEGQSKFPVFIDSNKKILSMPPIINSRETGKITKETKEIFIECSGFNLESLKKTLNILVTILSDMGGEIYAMELDYGNKITTPNLEAEKKNISLDRINSLLGLSLKEKDIEKLLPRMGYNYKNSKVEIPAWRTDILHEVDIIEDIAIAYGYDKLIPEIPKVATTGEENRKNKIKDKIAEILIGLGLIETSSYHLITKEEASFLPEKIEVENSKTDYKFLRQNLLTPGLRVISENKDKEYPQNVFEIGIVFSLDKETETGIKEKDNLLILLTPGNFTEVKQILDHLTRMLNLSYKIREDKKKGLIEGRTGSIIINGKEIGYSGEIHPETLRDSKIKMPVSTIEISLEEIFKL